MRMDEMLVGRTAAANEKKLHRHTTPAFALLRDELPVWCLGKPRSDHRRIVQNVYYYSEGLEVMLQSIQRVIKVKSSLNAE